MVKHEFRLDRGTLRRPKRLADGSLRVDGLASRTGVFEYRRSDGSIRRELRLDDEVFAPKALEGFEGITLTDGHPEVAITLANRKQYEVGTVTTPARRDGDHVATTIVITDAKVIAKVEGGDTGLSVGYAIDVDETSGVHPQWGRYDAIQRNLVINHLAVGVQPRAGNTARIRMDSVSVQIDPPTQNTESHTMADETAPASEDMSLEEQVRFLKAKNEELQAKLDKLEADAQLNKDRADGLQMRLEIANKDLATQHALHKKAVEIAEGDEVKRLIARADAAELELTKLRNSTPAMVVARAELLTRARTALGKACRFDATAPDRVIEETIIKHYEPTFRTDGLSDLQIKERADALYQSRMRNAQSNASVGELLAPTQTQEVRMDSREARAKAWREQALNGGYKVGNAGRKDI